MVEDRSYDMPNTYFNWPSITRTAEADIKPFRTGRDTKVLVKEPTRNIDIRTSSTPHEMVHAKTMCNRTYVGCKL